jgi:cytochrome c2
VSQVDIQGDAAHGEDIFRHGIGGAPGCVNCHSLTPSGFAIGPDLHGVAGRAAERVEGLPADDYLHASIVAPAEFITPGYRDMMYRGYADVLSEQDVLDLVAFLNTL